MSGPTIRDIARDCNVSVSTVSLVINGHPRISDKTRAKVLAAMEASGYQPNAFAQSLASKSSMLFGVVVPRLSRVFANVYFGEIISGIYDCASEIGYKMLLDVADDRFLEKKEHLRLLKSRRVDGIIFLGASLYGQHLLDLDGDAHPFVLVNHYVPGRTFNFIASDYAGTGRVAARHLLDLGHRRIGVLAGTNANTIRDFQTAFSYACALAGVTGDDLLWADGWFSESGGYEGARQLLLQKPGLTAIMAANDRLAIGAMRYLREHGLRVPDDISVMGVDDIPGAAFSTPALTTVRHDLHQTGRMAAEGLLAVFQKKIPSLATILPVELVVRESTGPSKPS